MKNYDYKMIFNKISKNKSDLDVICQNLKAKQRKKRNPNTK